MTKKQLSLYNRFLLNHPTTLEECYAKPSFNKRVAYASCIERYNDQNGNGFCIMGFNHDMFSVAWTFTHPVTGQLWFHYETNRNIQEFPIEF